MRYAQVIDGKVENVIVLDGETPEMEGELIELTDEYLPVSIGWSYKKSKLGKDKFTAPPQSEAQA